MEEVQYSSNVSEAAGRLRDLEEKQRLLKDRLLLVGKSVIEEREKNFNEIQELKKSVIFLKEENSRLKEIVQRMAEQVNVSARKEELSMLQRQFDLFRKER